MANGEIQTFIERVAELVSKDLVETVLTTIVSGSVVVGGEISANNETEANSLTQTLSDNSNNLGVTVTNSNFQTTFDGNAINDGTTTSTSDSSGPSVGLIVGCTIGGVVLVAIIAFVVYKVKSGKSESQQIDVDETRVQNEKDQIVSWLNSKSL